MQLNVNMTATTIDEDAETDMGQIDTMMKILVSIIVVIFISKIILDIVGDDAKSR